MYTAGVPWVSCTFCMSWGMPQYNKTPWKDQSCISKSPLQKRFSKHHLLCSVVSLWNSRENVNVLLRISQRTNNSVNTITQTSHLECLWISRPAIGRDRHWIIRAQLPANASCFVLISISSAGKGKQISIIIRRTESQVSSSSTSCTPTEQKTPTKTLVHTECCCPYPGYEHSRRRDGFFSTLQPHRLKQHERQRQGLSLAFFYFLWVSHSKPRLPLLSNFNRE